MDTHGYAIDGFKSNRDNDFETKMNNYDRSLGKKGRKRVRE